MARSSRLRALKEPGTGFDVSSLIDVCFLLLIYFVVTTTIAPIERDLGMKLPGEKEAVQQPLSPLQIQIGKAGEVSSGLGAERQLLDTDASVRELPQLAMVLELYKDGVEAAGDIPQVVIDADPAASHQRLIDVINALSEAEITSVSISGYGKAE